MSGLVQAFDLTNPYNILRLICGLFFIPHIYAKFFVPEALGFFVAAKFKPPNTPAKPRKRPIRTGRKIWPMTMKTMAPSRAPRALRIPNSRVRCDTEYEITP